jgi:pimeloyl-ACP methyl ester carboxylesterase
MEMIGKGQLTTVDGCSIAWGELGTGTPLVLLHGLGDSHRTWRRAAPLLASRFRVLMPDLPGHGLSGRPDAPYTLEWYARTMTAWMDAIDVPRAHLGGHSFGGGVAQWILLERRPRIDRLALVASGGLGREVGVGLRLAAFPVLGPLLAPPLVRVGTKIAMQLAGGLFGQPEPEEIERLAWMNAAPRSGVAFRRTVTGCIDLFGQYVQTWHRIHEVDSLPPLALFWGDRDPILPIHHGRAVGERVAFATLETYRGVGHFPHLEATERFSRDLASFLDDAERAPARLMVRGSLARRPRGARASVSRFFRKLGHALRSAIRRISIH